MRRMITIPATLVLAGLLVGPVSAAQPFRETTSYAAIECPNLAGEPGVAALFGEVFSTPEFEDAFFDVGYWAGLTEPAGEPTLFSTGSVATLTDDVFEGIADLADATGEVVETAVLAAELSPIGDPVAFTTRDRFDNRWRFAEGTEVDLAVTGTLTIGEEAFDLSACHGHQRLERVFETRPNAVVGNAIFRDVHCQLAVDDRVVFVDGFGGEAGLGLNVFVDPDGLFAFGDLAWVSDGGGGWTAGGALEVFDGDFESLGLGSVDLHLIPDGDPIVQVLPRRAGWEKSVFQRYTVSGSLDLGETGIATDDLSGCDGLNEELRFVGTSQKGPRAPTPPNDAPAGAIELEQGDAVSLRTGGAADSETGDVSCLESIFGTTPFVRTVWYTVSGDGSPLTIDTAGSDYDTVIAVYVEEDLGDGPALTEVACVDDVFLDPGRTIQAALELETEANVVYWIQVGGWNNEWGRLRMTVS